METGQKVLIRSHQSGVWMGRIVSVGDTSLTLRARRLWQWKGALDCSVLAVQGPGDGSRISAKTTVELPLAGIVETHATTKVARAALREIEVAL